MEKASVEFLIIAAILAGEIKNVGIVAAIGAAVPKIIHRVPPAESAPCALVSGRSANRATASVLPLPATIILPLPTPVMIMIMIRTKAAVGTAVVLAQTIATNVSMVIALNAPVKEKIPCMHPVISNMSIAHTAQAADADPAAVMDM